MSADTGTATGSEASRIHNIGYRSYDGVRLGRSYARRSLYSQSLRGAFGLGRSAKSKVLPMLLCGVMCLVALIIVAVAMAAPTMTKLPVRYTSFAIYLQAVIGLFADREVEFGGDHEAVARIAAQRFSEHAFSIAGAVLIGGVEEGDAVVKCGMNAADGLVARDAAGDGEPCAEAQFGNVERAIAEVAILHGFLPVTRFSTGRRLLFLR